MFKVLATFLMLMSMIAGGVLPLKWKSFRKIDKILSFLYTFSGGMLLSLAFLRLFPEAIGKENLAYQYEEHFPLCALVVLISFSGIIYFEKMAFPIDGIQNKRISAYEPPKEIYELAVMTSNDRKNGSSESDHHLCSENQQKGEIERRIKMPNQVQLTNQGDHHHSPVHQMDFRKPYLLATALGMHSVFGSIAIGVADDISETLVIVIVILIRIWADGLSLGIAFFDAKLPYNQALTLLCIQAIMSPIGLIIGWIFSGLGLFMNAILTSISVGALLYISTTETLSSEFSDPDRKYSKILSYFLGIVCQLILH